MAKNEIGKGDSSGGESAPDSLPRKEGRIAVQIPAQVPCEQSRLELWQHADRHRFIQERMRDLVLLPLLPGDQHCLSLIHI